MKKFILSLIFTMIFISNVFAAPTNTMSISPSAVNGQVDDASDENTRNNEVSTKFNAHSHSDISQTANTLNVGDASAGNKTVTAYNADTNKPYLRFDDTNDWWEVSVDGTSAAAIYLKHGIVFEGATNDGFEVTLSVTDPTADRTQTIQNNDGTIPLGTSGNTLFFVTSAATSLTLPTSGTLLGGPGSSTDNAIVRWDGTGGSAIQNSSTVLIDDTGRITNSAQPAFCVVPAGTQANLANGTTIIFDSERFDVGNNFASNTFTAPVTGRYQISFCVDMNSVDMDATTSYPSLVSSNLTYSFIFSSTISDVDDYYYVYSGSLLIDMDASDTVYLRWDQAAGANQADCATNSAFSGFLVS